MMGPSAHTAHVFADIVAHNAILKLLFPIALEPGRLCRITRELGMVARFRGDGLSAGQVYDEENDAAGNEGADGIQACLLWTLRQPEQSVSESWNYRA
jgi:hypothetical protein